MRYTLRLLTAQQFLRAASLICVLEDIRSQNAAELGEAPFGIGVWLGGDSTPNTWNSAQESLRNSGEAPRAEQIPAAPVSVVRHQDETESRAAGRDIVGYESPAAGRIALR